MFTTFKAYLLIFNVSMSYESKLPTLVKSTILSPKAQQIAEGLAQ
jgi:hypothetical protein